MAFFSLESHQRDSEELLDSQTFYQLQEKLSKVTGLPISTFDAFSKQICPSSKPNPFCAYLTSQMESPEMQARCKQEHYEALKEALKKNKKITYRCHMGLLNCAIPISMNHQAVGAVLTGQVFDAPPDHEKFSSLSSRGLDGEKLYQEASALSQIQETQFQTYMELVSTVVEAVARERYQKLEETRRAKILSFISELSRRAGEDVMTVLNFIALNMPEVCDMEKCTVFLLDEETGEMVATASSSLPQEELAHFRIPVRDPVTGQIAIGDAPFISSNAPNDPRLIKEYVEKCAIKSLITVPLKVKDEIIGVIHLVNSQHYHPFSAEEVSFISALAVEISLIIEASFLEDDRRKKAQELEQSRKEIQSYFTQIGKALSSALNVDSLLSLIASLSLRVVKGDACSLFLVKEGEIERKVVLGVTPEAEQAVQLLVDANPTIWIGETPYHMKQKSPPPHPAAVAQSKEQIKSFLRIPLRSQDEPIGFLNIYTKEDRIFSKEEVEILSAFASQAALAITNARLLEVEQKKAREVASLYESTRAISSNLEMKEILFRTGQRMAQAADVDRCLIFLLDEERKVFTTAHAYGVSPEQLEFFQALALPSTVLEGAPWENFRNGHALVLSEVPETWTALRNLFSLFQMKSCLLLPLMSERKLIGIVYLDDSLSPHYFTEDQIRTCLALSVHAATAIERAQLDLKLEDNMRQIQTLYQLSIALSSSLQLKKISNLFIEKACQLININRCCLFLWDEKLRHFAVDASKGLSEAFIKTAVVKMEDKFVSRAAQKKKPVYSANVLLETDNPVLVRLLKNEGLGAVLSVPLVSKKKVLGVLTCFAEVGYQFTEKEIYLLSNFASHVALSIENAQMYELNKQKVQELGTLFDVGKTISSHLHPDDVLKAMGEHFPRVLKADGCSIMLLEEGEQFLSIREVRGLTRRRNLEKRIRVGEGIVGKVARTGQPMTLILGEEKPGLSFPAGLKEEGVNSILSVPLSTKEKILGVVSLYSIEKRRYTSSEIHLLTTLAGQGSVALRNARTFEEHYNVAQMIHRSLLPEKMPDFPGVQFGVKYLPSLEISGDYYDFLEFSSTSLGITIADVSGKGTEAATFTAQGKYALKSYALIDRDPHRVLHRLNRFLAMETPLEKFITMFYGVLDIKLREFHFSNAGHLPPILYKSSVQRCRLLHTSGMILGVDPEACYSKKKIVVRPGDILVFYTDGVTEARNPEGKIFSIERLQEVIKANAEYSPQIIANRIHGAVQKFTRQQHLIDDFTLLLLKIKRP